MCDKHGGLLGVVSQSDVSDKVAAENKCPAWMHVSEIMTRQLVSATLETSLEDCLRLMEQHGIYHLVVFDYAEGLSRHDFRYGLAAVVRVRSKSASRHVGGSNLPSALGLGLLVLPRPRFVSP